MYFIIFFTIATIYIAFFEYFLYRRWQKRLSSYKHLKLISILYWGFVSCYHLLIITTVLARKTGFKLSLSGTLFPVYALMLSWQFSLTFLSLVVYFLLLSLYLYDVIDKAISKRTKNSHAPNAISRKQMLLSGVNLASDLLPFIGTGLGLVGIFSGSKELVVDKVAIKINNLHEDLKGFKIAQISDIHIGYLIDEKYLKVVSDLLLQTKADMLVVTGDIVDNDSYYSTMAAQFFRSIERYFPYGCYGIMGNHDYIDNGLKTAKALNQSGLKMLMTKINHIQKGNGRFQLIGLNHPPLAKRDSLTRDYFDKVRPLISPEIPSILLNHNPRHFEYFKQYPIDLVLSGHTHGGQIRFSDDRESPLSICSLALKYYIGLYQENHSQLYVNRGTGHWLPLRIQCPPEITLFELV